ncbi:hypothetical protein AYO49_05360 [Verrucomicrobiaceae bacterium SCGC AG-212-N21]|nr:hypothetical protein AYO49_05360 [Verrucomicrobiaceae bacterium SCGC AG-212-N21]
MTAAKGLMGSGGGAGGAGVGDVMDARQFGQGPVTPAISIGTVSSVPQVWQLKWMTLGAGFMSAEARLPFDQIYRIQFSYYGKSGKTILDPYSTKTINKSLANQERIALFCATARANPQFRLLKLLRFGGEGGHGGGVRERWMMGDDGDETFDAKRNAVDGPWGRRISGFSAWCGWPRLDELLDKE